MFSVVFYFNLEVVLVMAKLHIICGNCGCNDDFEYRYQEALATPIEIIEEETVYIKCRNCSTIHNINDNAEKTDD